MTDADELVDVASAADLQELIGEPHPRAWAKERTRLHERDAEWLAASPLCFVATCDADGNCDVSPKGDPPSFTLVLDDATIALPERPGNRRTDGFLNILSNPHIGLLFLVPGRGDTLRINGRARLVRDAPFFDRMTVKGHRPTLAVVVAIDQIFFHCPKAFLRSRTWQPESWRPDEVSSRARIAHQLERSDQSLDELEHYYGPSYAERLYGQPR